MSKNICEQCGGITGPFAQKVANTMSLHAGLPAFVCPGHLEPSPRDTQFAGFAEKLYQEIEDLTCSFSVLPSADEMKRLECEIIARRAYDLVQHALSNEKLQWRPLEDISVSDIPDLTEWPKEQEA